MHGKKLSTRTLTAAALLAAMSIVLARFCVIYLTPSVRISFGNIPIMLASLMFGPVIGAACGGAADIIGSALLSGYGWYPPLTVGPVLMGVIPSLLRPLFRNRVNYARSLIFVLIPNIVVSMGYSTWCLHGLNGQPIPALLAARVPLYLGISAVEALVVMLLIRSPLMRAAGVEILGGGRK